MEDSVMAESKRRQTYSPEFKTEAVARMRAGESLSGLAQQLGVRRKFLYEWKHAIEEGRGFPGSGHPFATAGQPGKLPAPVRDGAERIKELEALAGRLTLENRFFKGALQSIEELRQLRSASSSAASSRKSKR
jgi:transposase-like protein